MVSLRSTTGYAASRVKMVAINSEDPALFGGANRGGEGLDVGLVDRCTETGKVDLAHGIGAA